tara:strand:+ start:20064 stop:20738 length:675 start_codon:yes stop_codon:yes gene_type:complete
MWYSRHQPFPEISGRFSALLLTISLLLWLSSTAPRDTSEDIPAILAASIGGLGVVFGVRHMTITHHDVVVAPFGGVLLCIGSISLLSDRWGEYDQSEQLISFALASILVMLEIYICFRGLVIGIQGISWSKSGLRQVRRGLLVGPRGAVSHFEKSWHSEDQWLTAMSHSALMMIHQYVGNTDEEIHHKMELEKFGGLDAVDSAWIEAIRAELSDLKSPMGLEEE